MKPKEIHEKLLPGKVYHIYNRAVGDELLFRNDEGYYHFMRGLKRFVIPYTRLFAYCLIPNHFHFLIGIKNCVECGENLNLTTKTINQGFSNFFNSYARSYNKHFNRKGKLFMLPYKRILVEDIHYFRSLVIYIHRNSISYGLTKHWIDWLYSSYSDIILNLNEHIDVDYVLSKFDSIDEFVRFHDDLTG